MVLETDTQVASICSFLFNVISSIKNIFINYAISYSSFSLYSKLTFMFRDKLILRACKQLLFYRNHWAKLGLSGWSRIQSWGKTNINLSHRDFAQNAELRHTPWKLLCRRRTVNCKHRIAELLASGCRLAFFFDRPFIGGFRGQHGYYSLISSPVNKLAKTQHSCIIWFWVSSFSKANKVM